MISPLIFKLSDHKFKRKNWKENLTLQNLKFDFLDPQKKYKAIIYMDAKDADYSTNPAAYAIEQKMINAQTSISIPIAKGGGCAISIFEIK